MSDYNSGLPVRTEADGTDERLHVKVVDGATPSRRMTVDADLNAHVESHGNDPAGGDHVVRLSELGALTPDGVYDVSGNTKPGNVGLVASTRVASPTDSTQSQRLTSVTDTGGTVRALDVAMRDSLGNEINEANPLPVFVADSTGTEINDHKKVIALAVGATDNHDYTVTALKTLKFTQVECSGSGKIKVEVSVETGVATGVFNNRFVQFNSTSSPNCSLQIREVISVVAGVRVRLAITNNDKQPQDVYSTICGHEI